MKKLLLITCFIYIISFAHAATYYVSTLGQPTGNATSWATASSDLQWVINTKATFGDQVFVQMGPYYAPVGLGFQMKEGVKIYGGFRGNETALSQRDWVNNITRLVALNGRVITNNDNGLTNAAVLDGFRIEEGEIGAPGGGGMYNKNVSPYILNCMFKNNSIRDDLSAYGGGAVLHEGGYPVFFNCLFENNFAGVYGSGGGILYQGAGELLIDNCTFNNNRATAVGGGVYVNKMSGSNSASIIGCSFNSNIVQNTGGAIANGTMLKIYKCYFFANQAKLGGGAIQNIDHLNLHNSIFYDNRLFSAFTSESIGGSAIQNHIPGGGHVNGCTFVKGLDPSRNNSIFVLLNTVLSVSNSISDQPMGGTGVVLATHTLFPGGNNLSGNINADPKFVDLNNPLGADGIIGTADDGLRLQQNSPAVNRGSLTAINSSEAWDYVDFMGNLRIQGPYMDMGAYESPYTTTAALPATFGTIKATSNANSLYVNWQALSEKNVKNYEIQLSADGEQFTALKTINTKAENGNSDQPLDYTATISINELPAYMGFPALALALILALLPVYRNRKKAVWVAVGLAGLLIACAKQSNDIDTEKNTTAYLRLAQTDIDGTLHYSKTIKVVPE